LPFATVAVNVAILVGLAVPGFVLRKTKVLKENAAGVLALVLMFVAQPASVARAFVKLKYDPQIGLNILILVGMYVLVGLLVLAVAMPIFHKKDPETGVVKENHRMYRFAATFGNVGYLGIPLVETLFPDRPVMHLYVGICVVMFNLMTWTLGVIVVTADAKKLTWKKLLNPCIVAALVTVPFFLLQNVIVPAPVVRFVEYLNYLTAPISMLILGARMAEMRLPALLSDGRVYLSGSLRLVFAPLLTFGLLHLFGVTDPDLFNTLVIMSAMPAAASCIVFAERFLTESYTAVRCTLLTSLLCVVTMPVVCVLLLI
jgi:predicted permease